MQNAADSLTRSAGHYKHALLSRQSSPRQDDLAALNHELMDSERRLTNSDGLLRRSWYKHLLYAPGVYAGYEAKPVPGVREGIEQKKYAEAEQEILRVAKAIEEEAVLVDAAALRLEKIGQ